MCLTVYADNGKGPCDCSSKELCFKVTVRQGSNYSRINSCSGIFVPDTEQQMTVPQQTTSVPNKTSMTAYPNPFGNEVAIEWVSKEVTDDVQKQVINLYNATGQLVKTQVVDSEARATKIETASLPIGFYNITLESNGKVISTTKIVKQK